MTAREIERKPEATCETTFKQRGDGEDARGPGREEKEGTAGSEHAMASKHLLAMQRLGTLTTLQQ